MEGRGSNVGETPNHLARDSSDSPRGWGGSAWPASTLRQRPCELGNALLWPYSAPQRPLHPRALSAHRARGGQCNTLSLVLHDTCATRNLIPHPVLRWLAQLGSVLLELVGEERDALR